MKKMVVIIIILIIIFVGMLIYKNEVISMQTTVSVQEVEKIESYITKIYMWKEVTNEALPCFEDINKVDELWFWEVVKKNLEDYELTYEQINNKAQELFGSNLNKKFPKEGTTYLTYNNENQKYYATGLGLDQQEDLFLLNKIEKKNDIYEVEIVEYLEDYSDIIETTDESTGVTNSSEQIVIRNLRNEEISKINNLEEENAKEIVKNNIDRFTKKKVILQKDNDKLYVKSVSEIKNQ